MGRAGGTGVYCVETQNTDANTEKSKQNGQWILSSRKTHFRELMCNTSSISMRHCTGYTPDTGFI